MENMTCYFILVSVYGDSVLHFLQKKLWTLAWLYASIFDGVDGCHNCTSKISTGFFKFLAFFLDSCYCCLFDSIWSSLYRRG